MIVPNSNPSTANAKWLLDYITPMPNFPTPGVIFEWYGPLMRDPKAFARVIKEFAKRYQSQPIDILLGIESRGFIFCAALAYEMKVPFALIRKPGKLPGEVISSKFQKEYGVDYLEMEKVSLREGDKALIVDDVLATGGTALAACQLVIQQKAHIVEVACVIELPKLKARAKIPYPVFTLLAVE